MSVIKVRNTSSNLVGFVDLKLKMEAIRQDATDTDVPGKNLQPRRVIELEETGAGNAVQIVLSDYFTTEDIAESDGLKNEFEAGNITIYIDGSAISSFSEVREANVAGTIAEAAKDDVWLKQVLTTSYLGSALTKSGAKSLDIINYCDVPITIALASASDTWDATNVTILPATTYSDNDPLEPSMAEGINIGSHYGINAKTNSSPTSGKDYITLVKTT
jgi:hypothetical protein